MALPGREPTIAHVASIAVECADCGRNRWWRPDQLRRFGVTGHTPLSALAGRIVCSACRAEGLPGAAVSIQAAFLDDRARHHAEALKLPGDVVPRRRA